MTDFPSKRVSVLNVEDIKAQQATMFDSCSKVEFHTTLNGSHHRSLHDGDNIGRCDKPGLPIGILPLNITKFNISQRPLPRERSMWAESNLVLFECAIRIRTIEPFREILFKAPSSSQFFSRCHFFI